MVVEKLLYSTREAREVLGIGQTRLYELLAQGRLKAVKLGGQTKISKAELERFIAELPLCALQQNLGVAPESAR